MRKTPERNIIPLVQAALYYAQNGWPIFPLTGKVPFKDSKGYKDATMDEQQIRTWWTDHPTANIGLATGERSGVLVLDIDPPEGHFSLKELQTKHTPLPDTTGRRACFMATIAAASSTMRIMTPPWTLTSSASIRRIVVLQE